jgi:hypothetical protein
MALAPLRPNSAPIVDFQKAVIGSFDGGNRRERP